MDMVCAFNFCSEYWMSAIVGAVCILNFFFIMLTSLFLILLLREPSMHIQFSSKEKQKKTNPWWSIKTMSTATYKLYICFFLFSWQGIWTNRVFASNIQYLFRFDGAHQFFFFRFGLKNVCEEEEEEVKTTTKKFFFF